MRHLSDLLRGLFYHLFHRQGRLAAATVVAITGVNVLTSETGFSVLDHLERVPHYMVSIVGSAVLFNILLKHFNDVLARLLREGQDTEAESERTVTLIKRLVLRTKRRPTDASDKKDDPIKDLDHSAID